MLAISAYKKLIYSLTHLVFYPVGVTSIRFTSRKAYGEAGLNANYPSMQYIVLGYMIPVTSLSLI